MKSNSIEKKTYETDLRQSEKKHVREFSPPLRLEDLVMATPEKKEKQDCMNDTEADDKTGKLAEKEEADAIEKRRQKTLKKMNNIYSKFRPNAGQTAQKKNKSSLFFQNNNNLKRSSNEKQRFTRVLSQVKLLEQDSGAANLIKTLRNQAKTLKISRKKILQSS